MDSGVFDLLACHAGSLEWDDQGGDALSSFASCSHGCSAIIREDTVGDPFLGSVDDIDISASLGRGGDSGDVRPSCEVFSPCLLGLL